LTASTPLVSSEDLQASRYLKLRDVAAGMVALQEQGFTTSEGSFLTMTDGTYAMPDSKPYCFYHQQDREGAIRTGILYLSFGPDHLTRRSETEHNVARAITAGAVVAAMVDQGLGVVWDGDVSVRVRVCLDA
jgi:hypothetical protein